MEAKTQSGYLILADISGYTFFLANTELEHANIALSYLLETIVEKMGSALTISKLEGDAVLAYIEEGKLPKGETLLGLIDQTYLAFRDRAKTLHIGATCPCRACQAIPGLDLKFMVHYGEFIIQNVAGIKDLLGSDVNLVHRLAKNSVAKSTGWRGYALFTRPGLERSEADQQEFLQQRESYEHLGEVDTYVMNMQPRYETMKAV
jgi:class 3 adenylate cyclase